MLFISSCLYSDCTKVMACLLKTGGQWIWFGIFSMCHCCPPMVKIMLDHLLVGIAASQIKVFSVFSESHS